MAQVENVLIVGGGIAGMSLAISLGRRGVEVEIAEITPEWSVIGMGISLTGPALRALKAIDLLDRCLEEGGAVSTITNCDAHGNVRDVVELPRLNGPEYPAMAGIMRPTLHGILREAVEDTGARARLGATVTALEQTPSGVDVQFTDGTSATYDLVVGADGIHSKVRALVFGESLDARFTGQAVWRATVPRPPEVDSLFQFYGPRNKTGFNPVSRELMYMYLVENTDEPRRWPQEQLPVVMRELLADFGGLAAEAREQIVDPDRVLQRPIKAVLVRPPWHRGRVVLIGDAVHAAPPHLASGGAVAIEDAIVLAEMLESDAPIEDVLTAFSERRFDRCRLVVDNSLRLGEWEKHPGDPDADPAGVMNESYAALAQPY
jgi:2-polyprenyl-6-methoxyphenol hydroxylase-like FAD-dependent oxidoreductase